MRYSGVSRPSFEEPLIVSGQLKMTNVQERNNSRRRSLTPMAFGRFGWTPLPCVYPPLRLFFGRFWGTSLRDFRRRICYALGYFDLITQIKKRGRPRICTAEYWREYYTQTCLFAVCIKAEPVCLAGTLPDRKTARVSSILA